MAKIDFKSTDDLLSVIPERENRDWEFKDAGIFEKAKFGQWKNQDLPPIVSSFGNSNGGYLLLGKRDGVPVFDPVPLSIGTTSMVDHLALVIANNCVTPHYKDFDIVELPISGHPSGGKVLLIRFEDSYAAPFQSNHGPNYFWRLPGHCQPAPHFHLELLRGRTTRAVIKIHSIEARLQTATLDQRGGSLYVNYSFILHIENASMQIATA